MPTQRLSMRRIKQLLTMHFGAGASTRAIGRELGIAPSTVREYLGRAASSESAGFLPNRNWALSRRASRQA